MNLEYIITYLKPRISGYEPRNIELEALNRGC